MSGISSNISDSPTVKMRSSGLVCVILVAGHSEKLETDLKNSTIPDYVPLKAKPKALLPVSGEKCILDYWWDVIKARKLFSEVYLVTNADKYKHYERWASSTDFPTTNIINDGSTLAMNSLGALGDLELAVMLKNLQSCNVVVIAGDMLFQDSKFDMEQVVNYFWQLQTGNLAIYYEMHPKEDTKTRGIVEICPSNNKILSFKEKPNPNDTSSRFASVVFYALEPNCIQLLNKFKIIHHSLKSYSFGAFIQWLINHEQAVFYGMKLPTGFQLIGNVGLQDYETWINYFKNESQKSVLKVPFKKKIFARIGLLGNPSDGFFGKTISLSIQNFWAEVSIVESTSLRLVPHPLNDPTEFGSLSDLYSVSSKEGYMGGLRLLQATCKKFYQYCSSKGIALTKRNFTLSYDTNIPRQVGLAGSSAIVTATLKCLMTFYNLNDSDMPKEIQPNFILGVEKEELMINAGLQDRVVQVYEGLVYMDFSKDIMQNKGHGTYSYIKVQDFPSLFLAYENNPSDSGRIHSNVAARFLGDEQIIEGMETIGNLAYNGMKAIEDTNWEVLAHLMDENFLHRRDMYGVEALGTSNMEMIKVGQRFDASVKFPGSGGAVIGIMRDHSKKEAMIEAYRNIGCVVVDVIPLFHEENSAIS